MTYHLHRSTGAYYGRRSVNSLKTALRRAQDWIDRRADAAVTISRVSKVTGVTDLIHATHGDNLTARPRHPAAS
jgi:hypothetical protein